MVCYFKAPSHILLKYKNGFILHKNKPKVSASILHDGFLYSQLKRRKVVLQKHLHGNVFNPIFS